MQTGMHGTFSDQTRYNEALKEHLAQFAGTSLSAFSNMLDDLSKLHIKYLQQLLSDLNDYGAMPPFYGDYYRMMVNTIETIILERTILK